MESEENSAEESHVNNDIEQRLRRLAEIIRGDSATLNSFSNYLRNEHGKYGGPSMLGLICEAYRGITGNGWWESSNESEIWYFIVGGEVKDKVLPDAVVEYFGLGDNIGTFCVGELPQPVKNSMNQTRKNKESSLLEIGRTYRNNGKEIAALIIESLPRSLRKQEPNWLTEGIPPRKPPKINLTGIQ